MEVGTRDTILKAAERYVQQGKLDAALAEYRKILRADPRDLTVANTVGDLYARLGRADEAIKHYLTVAGIFESGGFLSKATAMYKKIAKLDPNNLDATLRLASFYARQNLMGEAHNQYMAAVEIYRRAGKRREAIQLLKKIAEVDSGNPRVRFDLARVYEQEGMKREASEAYRAAGEEFVRKGKPGEAVVAFKKALEIAPESRGALNALAETYARQGDVQSALDAIARALEPDPNNIDLIIILGRTFLQADMLEKAESTFERLFRLDSSRYDYLLGVARAYVDEGNYERTMAIVDLCVDAMLERRHKKKATALLKAILERDPGNVGALERLVGIYRKVGERRNLVNTLNTLVQAALERDMRAEAASALKLLVEIEPKKKAYRDRLARIGDEKRPATGLAVYSEEDARAALEDDYDSYGDHSTELLRETVASHPEFLEARLKLLEELVAQQPSYVEGRLKLRQLYIDGGQVEKAAAQSLELARFYEEEGDEEMAAQYRAGAAGLRPDAETAAETAAEPGSGTAAARAVRLSEMIGVEEFEKLFEAAWRQATDDRKPLSVVKVGVDGFDALERCQDPVESVRCLERVAAALTAQTTRAGQLVATNGADEFFALLPETHPGAAGSIAEGMRKGVEALALSGGGAGPVTVSVGVATAVPHRAPSAGAFLASVDRAFGTARANGGNRVVTVPLLAE